MISPADFTSLQTPDPVVGNFMVGLGQCKMINYKFPGDEDPGIPSGFHLRTLRNPEFSDGTFMLGRV